MFRDYASTRHCHWRTLIIMMMLFPWETSHPEIRRCDASSRLCIRLWPNGSYSDPLIFMLRRSYLPSSLQDVNHDENRAHDTGKAETGWIALAGICCYFMAAGVRRFHCPLSAHCSHAAALLASACRLSHLGWQSHVRRPMTRFQKKGLLQESLVKR